MLKSSPCTKKQLLTKDFEKWAKELNEPMKLHRKLWEWCYISQVLHERGMLQPGKKGLGFAVGKEPLISLFAKMGCDILATDMPEGGSGQSDWASTNQHSTNVNQLVREDICPLEEFNKRVKFRPVDMNKIPSDLGTYDFIWSSCSIEHLGNLRLGTQFIVNMTKFLKKGGIAVHTTELNVSSNDATVDNNPIAIFRKKDFEFMKELLNGCGHMVEEFDFFTGDEPEDLYVDPPPYPQKVHLKLLLGPYAATSFGIIVTAGEPHSGWQQLKATMKNKFRNYR
jgi:2-polyprenyl-3-methyl-5-hydroxy-6-metoxy-1,4-benzoquinol methylase